MEPEVLLRVQAKQRAAKARKQVKKTIHANTTAIATHTTTNTLTPAAATEHPTRITSAEYFAACPAQLFQDPSLIATEENIELIMHLVGTKAVIGTDGETGEELTLEQFNYFIFGGTTAQRWDPTIYAKLAHEGFFTITTGRGRSIQPLPELQP
jgi:hypothetical protein